MIRGRTFLTHLRLQLLAQARNRQSLAYGLAVPLFFLLGFGALFRSGDPPLLAQMGQLVTITLLGGACFGLPTALVAEREAGVWRRHRLGSVSLGWILMGMLLVRAAWVLTGVGLQVVLAHFIFGAPWPAEGVGAVGAVLLVLGTFLSLGLVVAALANTVPSVQAIGQLLFLPMIMLGGVGVPLAGLPAWAQQVSAFMPGRYAVELLQAAWLGVSPEGGLVVSLVSLVVIGCGAAAVGMMGFRWDHLSRPNSRQRVGQLLALVPWLAVGLFSAFRGTWMPPQFSAPYAQLTDEQIRSISFRDLPGDDEFVTPMAPADLVNRPALRDALTLLATWPPGQTGVRQRDVFALVNVAALADAAQDVTERDYARAVYEHLRSHYPRGELRQLLAWIVFNPKDGDVFTAAPELGIRRRANAALVRERCSLYARKFLGRLEGAIKEPPVKP